MRARFPKFLTGGLAAVALTAAIGGAALAQTPPATPSGTPAPSLQQRADEFLSALAGRLGKTPDEVRTAVVETQKERIAQEVQAGRLTQEQADRLNQRIEQAGGLGILKGPGFGGRGHHGKGLPGPGMSMRGGFGGADVASFLGVQPAELMQELAAGKSLAQVAQEKGKSRDELKTYLTDQARNRLDQAVQSGRITQAQADQQLAALSAQLDQMIDRSGPVGGPRGRGPRGNTTPPATTQGTSA